MSFELKVIFLYFKKNCTIKEISELFNISIEKVGEIISTELETIKLIRYLYGYKSEFKEYSEYE